MAEVMQPKPMPYESLYPGPNGRLAQMIRHKHSGRKRNPPICLEAGKHEISVLPVGRSGMPGIQVAPQTWMQWHETV